MPYNTAPILEIGPGNGLLAPLFIKQAEQLGITYIVVEAIPQLLVLQQAVLRYFSVKENSFTYCSSVDRYKELRKELKEDFNFLSSGDTEVVLAAWMKWGENFLHKLNGMFSFCIWDEKNKRAFLARDRFGQKPFFYYKHNKHFLFSSEIKGLLASGIRSEPNNSAWLKYLYKASYDDSRETFFKNIYQLEPGECAWWDQRRGMTLKRWYKISEKINFSKFTMKEASNTLTDLLFDVGKLHMRSDVPIGLSLSGGLDSSILMACMNFNKRDTQREAISVEFGGKGGFSEREWVVLSSKYFGVSPHIETYYPNDCIYDFVPLLWHNEAPLGGVMHLGRTRVMSIAKKKGIRVMQDGTGLDEIFGGYKLHHDMYMRNNLGIAKAEYKKMLKEYSLHWGREATKFNEKALSLNDNGQTLAIDGTQLTNTEALNISSQNEAKSIGLNQLNFTTGDAVKDSMLEYLLIRKIPRNNLFTDRMSMAYGVELRFPFLDHRLVELGINFPNDVIFF